MKEFLFKTWSWGWGWLCGFKACYCWYCCYNRDRLKQVSRGKERAWEKYLLWVAVFEAAAFILRSKHCVETWVGHTDKLFYYAYTLKYLNSFWSWVSTWLITRKGTQHTSIAIVTATTSTKTKTATTTTSELVEHSQRKLLELDERNNSKAIAAITHSSKWCKEIACLKRSDEGLQTIRQLFLKQHSLTVWLTLFFSLYFTLL